MTPQPGLGLIALGACLCAAPLSAQNNYLYEGAVYEKADAPYATSDRVVGEFTLTQTLPPNAPLTDVRPLMADFLFFDSQAVRRPADSELCEFRVATDAAGDIVQYEIWLRQSDTAVDENQHSLEVRSTIDLVGYDLGLGRTDCGATALSPRALVFGGGVWRTGSLFADGFEQPEPR
jgi:hypothetical protein